MGRLLIVAIDGLPADMVLFGQKGLVNAGFPSNLGLQDWSWSVGLRGLDGTRYDWVVLIAGYHHSTMQHGRIGDQTLIGIPSL